MKITRKQLLNALEPAHITSNLMTAHVDGTFTIKRLDTGTQRTVYEALVKAGYWFEERRPLEKWTFRFEIVGEPKGFRPFLEALGWMAALVNYYGLSQDEIVTRAIPVVAEPGEYHTFGEGGVFGGQGLRWWLPEDPAVQYAAPIGPNPDPHVSIDEARWLLDRDRDDYYRIYYERPNRDDRVLAIDRNIALALLESDILNVERLPDETRLRVEYRTGGRYQHIADMQWSLNVDYDAQVRVYHLRVRCEVYPDHERYSNVDTELHFRHWRGDDPKAGAQRFQQAYRQMLVEARRLENLGERLVERAHLLNHD